MDLNRAAMLSKLADYFIPAHYNDHPDDKRLARLLVFIFLYGGLAELLNIPSGITLGFAENTYLLLTGGLSCFVLLLLFRRGLSLVVCVNLHIGIHAVMFFLQAWWGGGVESPATFALFFLPAIAMLLLGQRPAMVWLCICLSLVTFLYLYEQQVGALPVHYDIEKKDLYFYLSIVGEIVVLFAITLAFNDEKNRAINSLIQKNEQLVTTQDQLIQKEKMASLGELTAGIAHEIQNPLNFVNNFAEVSTELVDELKEGPLDQLPESGKAYADEILADLSQNLQKITHHGGRASAIVRSMLEHSRMSTGERQLTDVNALCDEYLRLSYHGLRAKDKTFNASLKTDFDPTLSKLNMVPQDMGRVLLNLFNNAFYAIQERQKQNPPSLNGHAYQPVVTVSTKKIIRKGVLDQVEIRIHDNGTGIPNAVKDKIFQPFFTTKPTGEGTGLGLSLSYDIVTKGHGGMMRVDTAEGQGTEFTISLPATNG